MTCIVIVECDGIEMFFVLWTKVNFNTILLL